MRPTSCAKFRKSVLKKDSMSFEIQGNTEIDRQLSQSVGEPPLNSGATLLLVGIFYLDWVLGHTKNKPVPQTR